MKQAFLTAAVLILGLWAFAESRFADGKLWLDGHGLDAEVLEEATLQVGSGSIFRMELAQVVAGGDSLELLEGAEECGAGIEARFF